MMAKKKKLVTKSVPANNKKSVMRAVAKKAPAKVSAKAVAIAKKKSVPAKVPPIPSGFTTVTPYLVIKGAAAAIDFYKKAFGAKEIHRLPMPDGRIGHAMIRIGDAYIMLADEFPEMGNRGPDSLGGSSCNILLYVKNADKAFQQAIEAGAKQIMPLANMFWGDRYGKIRDPFGHEWSIATQVEVVTAKQMAKRFQETMANPQRSDDQPASPPANDASDGSPSPSSTPRVTEDPSATSESNGDCSGRDAPSCSSNAATNEADHVHHHDPHVGECTR
jgi:PhnB protein